MNRQVAHEFIYLTTISVVRVQGGYSAFGPCDIDEICEANYYRHHRILCAYQAGIYAGNIRDVAKSIRPYLKAFYRRRFSGLLPKQRTFGQVIHAIEQGVAGTSISVLQPRVAEMKALNSSSIMIRTAKAQMRLRPRTGN
jgi:hypothetical protein